MVSEHRNGTQIYIYRTYTRRLIPSYILEIQTQIERDLFCNSKQNLIIL